MLGEGNVYLDVGGHIGYHSAFASYKVGMTGQVFAFEAEDDWYSDVIGLPGYRVKEALERLGQNGFEFVA